MGHLKRMRRAAQTNPSVLDDIKRIKIPTICGGQICPPGWTCVVEQSGTTRCIQPSTQPMIGTLQIPQPLAPLAMVPAMALGASGIDWAQYWSPNWDDYRGYVNLQVFGKGLAAHAGKPPSLDAVTEGMEHVFQFVRTKAWPPPGGTGGEEAVDAAAEAAVATASEIYEEDVVAQALDVLLPKWMSKYGVGYAA